MRRFMLSLCVVTLVLSCVSITFAADEPPVAADVQAEFTMPIYRNPTQAELTVIVPKEMTELRSAEVSVVSPEGKEVWQGSFRVSSGRNACVLKNIGSLPPGRYMATMKAGQSTMKRMLRIERIPAMQKPEGPIGLRKIFFTPDNWLFESFRNLKIRYTKPKMTQAYRSADPNVINTYGNSLEKAVDGSYVLKGYDNPYRRGYLYARDARRVTLKSSSPDGPYTLVTSMPAVLPNKRLFKNFDVAGMTGSEDKYVMYDRASHGTYTLHDIGVIQNNDPHDFGCVQAGSRTYWVVARTSSGKSVFLRNEPLFRDVPLYTGDNFDDGFMTNDNFGNMWISDDGKTLFIARGQTVRRFAPYNVPYDLLPNSSRILTIYSTTDGISWKYCHSISSCGPLDNPFSQQYDADIRYMSDAGLHLAFVSAYDNRSQQIFLDLKYSRDGVNFYDFTDTHPFVKTDKPTDWYFGMLFTYQDIIQVGNRYYQLAYGASLPHYFAEPVFRHNKLSEVTADDYKSVFGKRRMAEQLPYFKSIGGWEGLAEHTRKGYYALGVMSYRADGWFGVQAGSSAGSFVTRAIKGGGALTVNAVVAKDGLLRVELLDAKGRVRKSADVEGDNIKAPVFAMPDGDFRLRVTMRRADLYTMYIEP